MLSKNCDLNPGTKDGKELTCRRRGILGMTDDCTRERQANYILAGQLGSKGKAITLHVKQGLRSRLWHFLDVMALRRHDEELSAVKTLRESIIKYDL